MASPCTENHTGLIARNTKRNMRWLLIYDNVDDVSLLNNSLLPSTDSIVITTQFKNVVFKVPGVRKGLKLDPLDTNSSLMLFEEIRPKNQPCVNIFEEREATHILLPSPQGLALAIEQIAAYRAFRVLTLNISNSFSDKSRSRFMEKTTQRTRRWEDGL